MILPRGRRSRGGWFRGLPEEIPEVQEACRPREWASLGLLNRLREAREYPQDPLLQGDQLFLYRRPGSSEILHLLLKTPGGLLFPVLNREEWQPEQGKQLKRFLNRSTPFHSILGVSSSVKPLAPLLPPPRIPKEFDLLTLPQAPLRRDTPLPGLTLLEGEPSRADVFFPLERGYQQDEVIVFPGQVNWRALEESYRRKVRRQAYLWVLWEGLPVAQAGTNAQGPLWDQLGGVYTAPEWRGRGIATWLVSTLARRRMAAGRRVCLFVNKKNQGARRVYEHIGFEKREDLSLWYF